MFCAIFSSLLLSAILKSAKHIVAHWRQYEVHFLEWITNKVIYIYTHTYTWYNIKPVTKHITLKKKTQWFGKLKFLFTYSLISYNKLLGSEVHVDIQLPFVYNSDILIFCILLKQIMKHNRKKFLILTSVCILVKSANTVYQDKVWRWNWQFF